MKQVILVIFVFINFWHISHAKEPLVFVTSAYEPYVIEEGSIITGIFPDIVKAVFHELNIQAEFRIQPWQRGETTVKSGEAFATFPYLTTELRAEDFNFSDPVICFFPKFYYKKERFPNGFSWENLTDFQQYTIGGIRGYWYKESLQAADLNVQYVTTDRQNILKLMKERIDFTLLPELVGRILIQKVYPHQRSAFAFAKKSESTNTFHLMVSKKYPHAKELTEKFNNGLRIIKGNGIYQKIFQQYKVPIEYETAAINKRAAIGSNCHHRHSI